MDLIDLNMLILEEIQCPACYEPMKRNIFLCSLGHSLCGSCKKVISKCPICYRYMGEARNWLLESVTCALYYPCPNSEQGCEDMFLHSNLDAHSDKCIHRTYECVIHDKENLRCTWKGLRRNLGAHVKTLHPGLAWAQNDSLIRWTKFKEASETKMVFIEEDQEEIFWLHRQQKDDLMSWCLQYLGCEKLSQSYKYEVNIFNKDAPGHFVILGNYAQPDLLPKNDYFNPLNCVQISLSIFHSFKDQNDTIWYKIKIDKESQEEEEAEESNSVSLE